MYVFGPVPSRRLGTSLGVSLIPSKVCSLSCVYCQIGKTDKYSISPKSYFDREEILCEINKAIQNTSIDYITFAGDGEPTLSSDLGWFLQKCKDIFHISTAVITNGTLIYKDEVADQLSDATLVLPSIDAGYEPTFKKINRPHKDLKFDKMIEGLIDFSNNYSGKIWTETMLVKNYNDNFDEINKIAEIIRKINPEKSFILMPTRPPQIDVKKPDPKIFAYAQKLILGSTFLDYMEDGNFDISNFNTLQEALENITTRHPLRLSQAETIATKYHNNLNKLIDTGKFIIKNYNDEDYLLPAIKINKEIKNDPKNP